MKNRLSFTCLWLFLFLGTQQVFSQVSGISYTLSPAVDYTWWDSQSGLKDGYMIGGKFGIGFGEYFELRANYSQALGLKTSFKDFGLANFDETTFIERDVDLTRWGGELKANFSRGKLLPFLTLGTGVQSVTLDSMDANKQIYVNIGAGVKLSVGDRYTLTLEAKNTAFNSNATQSLLTDEDRTSLGILAGDFERTRLKNWSVGASLQFYLGGRRPGTLSELDQAYFRAFSDGLTGVRIPVEPTLVKMNFNDALPYRDAWLAGGYAGFDFGPYVGIRGFYFQSMEDNKIGLDFDKLAMYGGEVRMKLNAAKGTVPYLIAGGGYINVNEEEYVAREGMTAESQAFAMGGAGLILPFSNRFKLFGSVRTVLTSGTNFEDLQGTDELKSSWMYSFGVNVTLGKKANDPTALVQTDITTAVAAQQAVNDANAEALKAKYEAKVIELEQKLNEAYATQDVEEAARLLREKGQAEQVVDELDKRKQADKAAQQMRNQQLDVLPSNSRLQMSPAEFTLLIDEILENMGTGGQRISPAVGQQLNGGAMDIQQALKQQELEKQISEIEKLLIQMNEREIAKTDADKENLTRMNDQARRDLTEFSALLMAELQKLNERVNQNNQEIRNVREGVNRANQNIDDGNNDNASTTPVIITTPTGTLPAGATEGETTVVYGLPTVKKGGNFLATSGKASKLSYQGMAGIAGFNLGGNATANIGFRWFYKLGDSKLELMPETFFGFGSPANFGISANGILPITLKKSPIKPYVGAGVGFMQIGDNGDDRLKTSLNIILGSYLKVGKGRVFADITGRNLFKYNQIIAGYRFAF